MASVALGLTTRRSREAGSGRVAGSTARGSGSPERSGSSSSEIAHAVEEALGVGALALRVGRVLALRPVQRDDQVVHRSGARDVEEAEALVVAHLLVDRDVGLEVVGDDLRADAIADRAAVLGEVHLHGAALPAGPRGETGDDGDRELEALGGVDRHDPHGVVVGLGEDRLGDPGPLGGLLLDPVEVGAQAAAGGLAPGAGLVDHEPEAAPHVAWAALGEPELEGSALAGDAVEQLGGGVPVARLVDRPQERQALLARSTRRRRAARACCRTRCARPPPGGRRDRRRHTRAAACAGPSRCGGGRWDRRRPAAPSAGRAPPGSRRRASCSRPGRGCGPR